jgi:glycosyltransferase involved in cell wall biosynthesis
MDEAVSNNYMNYKVSVVIPALNEAESLPFVLPRIPRDVHEVILVDGASIDGTMEKARELLPQIRLVHQDRPGKGAALRCGFAAATGDIVVHLDADGSTDPADIPRFVAALLEGADYAKGSRFANGARSDDITPLRRLGNWAFIMMANVLFGSRFTDITYGYNAMWRTHHALLAPEIDGWAHEIVGNIRAHRRGLRIVEIPSVEAPRIAGEAKLRTFSAGWSILKAIVGERFRSLPVPAGATIRPVMIDAGSSLPADFGRGLVPVPVVTDEPVLVPVRQYEEVGAVLAQADQAA